MEMGFRDLFVTTQKSLQLFSFCKVTVFSPIFAVLVINETKYLRIDKVKFVEDSLYKI